MRILMVVMQYFSVLYRVVTDGIPECFLGTHVLLVHTSVSLYLVHLLHIFLVVQKVYVDRVPGTLRGRDGTGLKVTISGGHFEENSADESGGAVYLHNGVSFDMTGGNFLKNTARYDSVPNSVGCNCTSSCARCVYYAPMYQLLQFLVRLWHVRADILGLPKGRPTPRPLAPS